MILTGNYTVNGGRKELYNLQDDPYETENLIAGFPDVTNELIQLLNEFKRQGSSHQKLAIGEKSDINR